MSTAMTMSRTHTTYTSDMRQPSSSTLPSIRQIMISGIAFDAPKFAVQAQVEVCYPESRGAEKFKTHYNWYKSRCNKQGTAERKQMMALWDAAFNTGAEDNVPQESNVSAA